MLRRARRLYFDPGRAGLLARAMAGSAGLRIIGMGLGFLVGVQLARGLGPAGYGVYGLAMSVIALMMVPTEFGVPQLITREVSAAQASGDTGLLRRLVRWSARLIGLNTLVLGAIAFFAFALGWVQAEPEFRAAIWWGLALLPIVALSNVCSAALRGLYRVVEGQVAELVIRPALCSLLLLTVTIAMGAAFLTPARAMACNVLAAGAGAIFALWKLAPGLRAKAAPAAGLRPIENWLGSALPLAMGDGMRVLTGHLAILVLGVAAARSEVGLYRVAYGIYTVATLPSALLNVACSPMLARLHEEGRPDAIQRMNAWMTGLLVAAALVFLLPFLLFGKQLIATVFGQDFSESNNILLVLLGGELVSALLGHPTIVLNMLRHDRAVTRFSLFSLLLNVATCLLLVPAHGAIGAAIGVSGAQVAWRLMASWHARRHLGLHTSLLAWKAKS